MQIKFIQIQFLRWNSTPTIKKFLHHYEIMHCALYLNSIRIFYFYDQIRHMCIRLWLSTQLHSSVGSCAYFWKVFWHYFASKAFEAPFPAASCYFFNKICFSFETVSNLISNFISLFGTHFVFIACFRLILIWSACSWSLFSSSHTSMLQQFDNWCLVF